LIYKRFKLSTLITKNVEKVSIIGGKSFGKN